MTTDEGRQFDPTRTDGTEERELLEMILDAATPAVTSITVHPYGRLVTALWDQGCLSKYQAELDVHGLWTVRTHDLRTHRRPGEGKPESTVEFGVDGVSAARMFEAWVTRCNKRDFPYRTVGCDPGYTRNQADELSDMTRPAPVPQAPAPATTITM